MSMIPKSWEILQVQQIASSAKNSIVGGPFGSDLVSKDYVSTGVPVIRGQNMGGIYIEAPFVFVSEAKAATLEANLAKPGDLIFTQRGTLGQVSIVPDGAHGRYLISQSQMKLSLNPEVAVTSYIFHAFNGPELQKTIQDSAIQTGVPHLNLGILRKINIKIPPLKEQRAIASALSDMDALLAKLDQLIAKKRDIKQAAMQELLTGRRRLPGFSGEWQKTNLGKLGDFLKGRGIKKDEVIPEGLPCVRYGEIYTTHNDFIRKFRSFISVATASESQRIQQGDLLFAASGETSEDIGKCIVSTKSEEAYAGGDIVILRNHRQDPIYMGYLMNQKEVVDQKSKMGQGDAVVHISATSLSAVEVRLPPLAEQEAMSEMFNDMDTEITALETRREKTRFIKQGMMQELLSGRVRLI